MLSLVLIAAFFVGASATNAFMDDSFAAEDDNNGNNGCENANPNAKACENNPNTEPLVQTVQITAFKEGALFEGADCRLSFDNGLIVDGFTDVNGEVLLIVPAELDLIREAVCFEVVSIPPGPAGRECAVSLNGVFTEIVIQISGGGSGGCF